MASYIKNISVKGLHRTDTYPGTDIEVGFGPGVNVVYGFNGSGKTTLMHILTNLCQGDIDKFQAIDFNSVSLTDDRHDGVRICKDKDAISIYRIRNGSDEEIDLDIPSELAESRRTFFRYIDDFRIDAEQMVQRIISGDGTDPFVGRDRVPGGVRAFAEFRAAATIDMDLPSVAYFPAYRSLQDLFSRWHDTRPLSRREVTVEDVFGSFTPDVGMMSLPQIESRLLHEVRTIVADVARQNRQVLSQLSIDVLSTLEDKGEEIRRETNSLRKQLRDTPMYAWLPEVATAYDQIGQNESSSVDTVALYKDALSEILREQTDRYAHIDRFLMNVNQFLIDKNIVISPLGDDTTSPQVGIKRDGDSERIGIDTMSSGERQIFSLLYAASFLGEHNLVLIDEPEISFHIDWQYQFGTAISEILEDKQLIMCTHSPDMLSALEDAGSNVIELDPRPVGPPKYLHEVEDVQR